MMTPVKRARAYDLLSVIGVLLLTAVTLITFRHYGASWDEPGQQEYGEAIVRFYTSGFHDRWAVSFMDVFYYGGIFEVPAALATRLMPFGVFETRHLLGALCGIVGIVGCWKLAHYLGGSGAAFWSGLLLALYPPYYGHMFINSKDIPFAAFSIWALYYLVRLLETETFSTWLAVKFGIAAGLAMGVRVGGLLLLCYFCVFAAVLALSSLRDKKALKQRVLMTLGSAIIAMPISAALMIVSWPYAFSKPVINTLNALAWFSKPSTTPLDYLPRYFVFKLPEVVLLLVAIGVCIAARFAVRAGMKGASAIPFPRIISFSLIAFAVLFPLAYAAMRQSRLYDEVRHFLFVIPPLFCLCGLVANAALERLLKNRLASAGFVALLIGSCALQVWLMLVLHPYEYAYYNHLIGGVRGASDHGYDTEYWATSYKEGVRRLADFLRKRDGASFDAKSYKIKLGGAASCARPYFPPNFSATEELSVADAYLTTTRYGEQNLVNGPVVVEIARFGVPFMIAKIPSPELK
jgi:hypothetical protein